MNSSEPTNSSNTIPTDKQRANQHTAFTELPKVDVSGLRSSDQAARIEVARQLDKAAREVGFLYVSGHGVPRQRIEKLKARAKEFFDQSSEEKMRYYIGLSQNHSGYVPMGEENFYGSDQKPDAKEAYDIGFELAELSLKTPVLGNNQWPDLAGFQEDIRAYYDEVMALGRLLFEGFALGLGLPQDQFIRNLSAPPSQLRLIHYFHSPDAAADRPGIGAHTDYEFFTILLPTSPGLQVLNGAGEWIDVPVLPDAFVINIGDMMEIATNGKYLATSHRVRKINEERYSFPLFCNLDYDTLVEPIADLCKDETPNYQPLKCGDHLLAQTIQTFEYMKKRVANGELVLPPDSRDLSSFGNSRLKESN